MKNSLWLCSACIMLCTYLLLIAIVGIILSDILLNICHFLLKSLCIFFGRFICSFKGCLASLHSLIVSTDFRCVNGFWIKPHFAEHTLSTVIQDKLCFVHTEISVRILGFLVFFLGQSLFLWDLTHDPTKIYTGRHPCLNPEGMLGSI